MAENKTQRTTASVAAFLAAIADPHRQRDAKALAALIQKATGERPAMWGSSIVGFGSRRYMYASGKEAEFMLTAFSPRKQNITLYLGHLEEQRDLLDKLGTHSCGKGCLYIKRLSDVHMPTLTKLVKTSVAYARKSKPS